MPNGLTLWLNYSVNMKEETTHQSKSTEEIIFQAAYDEFLEKGFEGARMQNIANRAGINKALLHYYYRSKERLFDAIVPHVIRQLPLSINTIIEDQMPFEKKIELIIELYISFLQKNPFIVRFVIREIMVNPEKLVNTFKKIIDNNGSNIIDKIKEMIEKEANLGKIKSIPYEHLIINIVSLCVFPFIARPMVENLILSRNKISFEEFIKNRSKVISEFIINAIKK